jgi:SPP1 gp7 family putative phage head morphogenesis protein
VVRALLADLDSQLSRNGDLIDQAGGKLQTAGADAGQTIAQQLPLGFIDEQFTGDAARLLVSWNRVSIDAISQLIDFTGQPGWQDLLKQYGGSVSQVAGRIALAGFLDGANPLRVARELRQSIEGLPGAYANTLMRTLFLNAYRRATTESYKANSDIVEYAVRVATLDNRVCMACVLLHGTIIPLDEPLSDHWNGRCTSVAKLRGIPLNIQTGRDWFLEQPDTVQQDMMGPAAFGAWQAGAIQLQDLLHTSEDPLFGGMVNVASLVSLLGDGAGAFYP